MGKNRDGAATDFQLKKLKDLGFKGKKPTTYREAENLIKRISRAIKSATTNAPIPRSPKPAKDNGATSNPTSRKKHGSDVNIVPVPIPSCVRVVGLVFAVTKKKAGKK